MPALKHVHTYELLKKRGKKTNYFRCLDPECTHKMPREELLGKIAKCVCGTEFKLTADDLRRTRPRCLNCSNTKRAREAAEISQIIVPEVDEIFSAAASGSSVLLELERETKEKDDDSFL